MKEAVGKAMRTSIVDAKAFSNVTHDKDDLRDCGPLVGALRSLAAAPSNGRGVPGDLLPFTLGGCCGPGGG
jgi:hypothetical protein